VTGKTFLEGKNPAQQKEGQVPVMPQWRWHHYVSGRGLWHSPDIINSGGPPLPTMPNKNKVKLWLRDASALENCQWQSANGNPLEFC